MMAEKETEQEMNRKEFIKIMGAVAGTAALGNIGFAEEGKKKMSKSIVVYFSHTGENYSVGVITVGNTAKVAKEIAAQTGAATWEIKEKNPYPEKYKGREGDRRADGRGDLGDQGEEPLSREVHAVHRSRKEGNAGEGAPGVRRRGA